MIEQNSQHRLWRFQNGNIGIDAAIMYRNRFYRNHLFSGIPFVTTLSTCYNGFLDSETSSIVCVNI